MSPKIRSELLSCSDGFWSFSVAELNFQVPVESTKTQPAVRGQIVPHELLLSLTSTVCKRRTPGQSAHDRHCEVASNPLLCLHDHTTADIKQPGLTLYLELWNQTPWCSLASSTRTQEIQTLSGAANIPDRSWQVSQVPTNVELMMFYYVSI